MKNIYITRRIPEIGIEMLKEAGHNVDVSTKDGVLTREELIEELNKKNYDAVLCLLTDKIDAEVYDATPNAKIFANYAVGYDNIDVDEAKKRNIIITNTPEVLSESVAEHTFALMLAIAHRIPESDKFMKDGKYEGWAPMLKLGTGISGKTLGILGAGRIGSLVAHHARDGFEMNIIYYDIKRNEKLESDTDAKYYDKPEEVLKKADFVTVHVPLLESTKHLINEEMLSHMKNSSYLINTSRGQVIDEKALTNALENKIIKGAALDVFENEPKLAKGLSNLDNVVLTPHTASGTEETRGKMAELAASNIIKVLGGEEPSNKV